MIAGFSKRYKNYDDSLNIVEFDFNGLTLKMMSLDLQMKTYKLGEKINILFKNHRSV